jgi:epsilon-lactone hydrolase
VLSPGEAATKEAIELAGFGGFQVISVDYRMPPDYPYPAAMGRRDGGVPRGAEYDC